LKEELWLRRFFADTNVLPEAQRSRIIAQRSASAFSRVEPLSLPCSIAIHGTQSSNVSKVKRAPVFDISRAIPLGHLPPIESGAHFAVINNLPLRYNHARYGFRQLSLPTSRQAGQLLARGRKKFSLTVGGQQSDFACSNRNYGDKLLEPSGKSVRLTPAEEFICLFRAAAPIARSNRCCAVAIRSATPRGTLLIGANEATCLYVLRKSSLNIADFIPEYKSSIYRNFSYKI